MLTAVIADAIRQPSCISLRSMFLQLPSEACTISYSLGQLCVLLISRCVRSCTSMHSHWKHTKNWYSRNTFRKMNQPSSTLSDSSSSRMAALPKKKLVEKVRIRKLPSLRCVTRMSCSWQISSIQKTSITNHSASLEPFTQVKLWKCSFYTHFPQSKQCSVFGFSVPRHSGQTSTKCGNSGAPSSAGMLTLRGENSSFLQLESQPKANMSAYSPTIALISDKRGCWQSEQTAICGRLMQEQMMKSARAGLSTGSSFLLRKLFLYLDLAMVRIMPWLSVFVARQLIETLSVI